MSTLTEICVSSDSGLTVAKCWCAECAEVRADSSSIEFFIEEFDKLVSQPRWRFPLVGDADGILNLPAGGTYSIEKQAHLTQVQNLRALRTATQNLLNAINSAHKVTYGTTKGY